MALSARLHRNAKALIGRITGLSCPVAGVSWTPPVDERGVADRLITFLEDRRILFNRPGISRYNLMAWCKRLGALSVYDIRKRLTSDLEAVGRDSTLGQSLQVMRDGCRRYLDTLEEDAVSADQALSAVTELQMVCRDHLARIVLAYDIGLDERLAALLAGEESWNIVGLDPKTPANNGLDADEE